MNPRSARPDPRLALLLGIPVLLGVALIVRAAWGPGPATGFRINRSVALGVAGHPELAWRGLQDVLEEYPEEPGNWLRAGRALRALGREEEAALHFRRGAQLDPDDETLRFELARALARAGLPGLAEEAADEALAIVPEHAGALYLKASFAAGRGETDAAVDLLGRALDLGLVVPGLYRFDPAFDSIRNDPRFVEAVLKRSVPHTFREDTEDEG